MNVKKHLEGKELLRQADVLLLLDVSINTLNKYVKIGLPKHKIPNSNAYYFRSEIIAWIRKHKVN